MDYNQLMIADDGKIKVDGERQFKILHNEIIQNSAEAANSAYKVATDIKRMHDEKLYQFAGFENFNDYTQTALGIGERQAYKYISIIDKFDKDFLNSNSKIGVTKLALIASIDNEDTRTEILETVEDTSVKELKEKVAALKKENSVLSAEKDEQAQRIEELESAEPEQNDEAAQELERLKAQIANERITAIEAAKKQKEYTAKLESDKELYEKQVEEQAQRIEELKKQKTEIKTETVVDEESAKKLAEAEQELCAKAAEIEALNKKLKVAADEQTIAFKIKFEQWQGASNEMLDMISASFNEEKQNKLKAAIKTVVDGWKL